MTRGDNGVLLFGRTRTDENTTPRLAEGAKEIEFHDVIVLNPCQGFDSRTSCSFILPQLEQTPIISHIFDINVGTA